MKRPHEIPKRKWDDDETDDNAVGCMKRRVIECGDESDDNPVWCMKLRLM